MDIKISKEKMLEMAQKLARMDFCPEQKMFYKNVLELLQADAEGRLVVLPCKVGDTVYEVQELRKRIQPYTVISVHISECSILFGWELKDGEGIYSNVNGFSDYAIGKTVFFSREEAEAALEKMGGGECAYRRSRACEAWEVD